MKKIVSTAVFFYLTAMSIAQNTHLEYTKALKVYNQTQYFETKKTTKHQDGFFGFKKETISSTSEIFHPTFAFQWKTKNNHFHEIELTNFSLGRLETEAYKIDSLSNPSSVSAFAETFSCFVSARYEYIIQFNTSKERSLVPSLGMGINPYYKLTKIQSSNWYDFPTSEMFLGSNIFISPRLTYFISSKMFIDLNIPISLLDTYILKETIEDPSVPLNQQSVASASFNTLPKIFTGRIGVGIKL